MAQLVALGSEGAMVGGQETSVMSLVGAVTVRVDKPGPAARSSIFPCSPCNHSQVHTYGGNSSPLASRVVLWAKGGAVASGVSRIEILVVQRVAEVCTVSALSGCRYGQSLF